MNGGSRILELDGIDVFYGASQILFGVSLQVERGQSLALLGRNGAGKSTTMKAIIGLAPARTGTIKVRGEEMQRRSADYVARAGIGFVPEDRQVFPEHSVEDNLLIGTKPGQGGRIDWTLERIYEVFPLLASMRQRMGGRLSGGEQQMLTIGRTLMGNPELLLLDEPSEGLAPLVVDHLQEQIARLKADGLTILLAEQNVEFSLDLADRVYILEKGIIRYTGTARDLRADEAVRHQFLAL